MSIYKGYKDALVISYQGNVKINNIPQNTRRSKVLEVARMVLNDGAVEEINGTNFYPANYPITQFLNLEYYKNNDIDSYLEKLFGFQETPTDFYIDVNWEDYKERL